MNSNIVSGGQLYLGGGGGAEDSVELDKRFLSALNNKKIVYIPIALTPRDGGYESCYDWITSTLTNASNDFIEITMWTDLNNKKLNDLENFGGVYIGGGNTYKLLDHLFKTGFNKTLTDYYYNGGLVYGGSAGAIILGKTISIISEENNADYTHESGLNLLNEKSVICHFTDQKETKISKFIQDSKTDVIALTERTGAIISNINQIESVGFDSVQLYSVSLSPTSINPGGKSTI